MPKFKFPKPTCNGRDCYADNRTVYNTKRACGRKLSPGERYCINGPKARQFRTSDAAFYTPKWCPKRYANHKIRVYVKRPENDLDYQLRVTYGEFPYLQLDAARYRLRTTTTTPYTPLQFFKKLNSGLCDYLELLGHRPSPYNVIEIDNGLTSTYLYYSKDYEWVQIDSFDKGRCASIDDDSIQE